ncbi:MAG TPA: hypothetical protein VFS97_05085 [Nitrososphaeraceae archaeon]|nr:hypothetical protein [Nitrososphaeraceae archaeon]
MYKTFAIMLTATLAVAAAALTTTNLSIQPTYAQTKPGGEGASLNTPGYSVEQSLIKGGASLVSPGSTLDSPASPPPGDAEAGWMPEGSTAIPGPESIINGVIGSGAPFGP